MKKINFALIAAIQSSNELTNILISELKNNLCTENLNKDTIINTINYMNKSINDLQNLLNENKGLPENKCDHQHSDWDKISDEPNLIFVCCDCNELI